MNIVEVVFWGSLAVVAYTYVGYPILLVLLTMFRRTQPSGRQVKIEGEQAGHDWPRVSLVIAAYREENVILERLKNAVLLDYPPDRFEIIIGCDGNEDLTGELVQSFGDSRVRLIQYPKRRGKASVLNDAIPEASGEIIVLSDANTMMDHKAIKSLVRHFVDPTVGGVCGKLILTDPATGQNVDSMYWRYENFLKRHEATLGALLGTNGAIYAIRKNLYRPIPTNTIIDDFLIGMRLHVDRYQLLFDGQAVAFEETPASIDQEFNRRARIGAGGFQSLLWLKSLLDPRRGTISLAFWSHKVLRWLCPAFLVAALVANVSLAADPYYLRLLVVHEAFYLAATLGLWLWRKGRFSLPLRVPAMFVSMNAALLVGFWRWASGIQGGTWKRTERVQETESVS